MARFAVLLCALLGAACSNAQAGSTPKIRLEGASARVLASGAGVLYLRVVNDGSLPDRLVSVDVPAARDAQLHEVVADGELSSMRAAPAGFVVEPHAALTLAHGGKHVMLFGVKDASSVERLHALLHFEKAGTVACDAPVQHGP